MRYAIVTSSKTGNAQILADRIKEIFGDDVVYFGEPSLDIPDYDIIFVGFWTNMGSCDSDTAQFLQGLHNKKIFLFGTAGFGLSQEYFDKITGKTMENIDKSNQVIDSFMCQGKMHLSVREKYVRLKESDNPPANIDMLISNFDEALMHPSACDLMNFSDKLFKLKKE